MSPLLIGAALVALAGVALAASLSWLHAQLDIPGGTYTSFCNVNETVNCDRVLTSPFAKLLGIPVANLALLAYVAITLALVSAWRGDDRQRSRSLRFVLAAVIGAAVFSAYMAAVSFFVLETVCLMCSGLYVVAAVLIVLCAMAGSRLAEATAGEHRPVTIPVVAAACMASLGAVAAISASTWPDDGSAGALSIEQIRTQRPEFHEWYTGLPVTTVPAGADRGNRTGPADAPVTIVEFFDFECGHCKRNHDRLEQLLAARPGEVRVVYRHFPLDPTCNDAIPDPIHQRACRAAEAAECAGRQGRFAEMAGAMFARQRQLFESNLPRIAERLGLDMDAFEACMQGNETLGDVVDDCRAGARLRLESTPTMFVNGRRIEGTIDEPGGYELAVTIERGLAP